MPDRGVSGERGLMEYRTRRRFTAYLTGSIAAARLLAILARPKFFLLLVAEQFRSDYLNQVERAPSVPANCCMAPSVDTCLDWIQRCAILAKLLRPRGDEGARYLYKVGAEA